MSFFFFIEEQDYNNLLQRPGEKKKHQSNTDRDYKRLLEFGVKKNKKKCIT